MLLLWVCMIIPLCYRLTKIYISVSPSLFISQCWLTLLWFSINGSVLNLFVFISLVETVTCVCILRLLLRLAVRCTLHWTWLLISCSNKQLQRTLWSLEMLHSTWSVTLLIRFPQTRLMSWLCNSGVPEIMCRGQARVPPLPSPPFPTLPSPFLEVGPLNRVRWSGGAL